MDTVLEIIMFSAVVILAIITLFTFVTEPTGDDSKVTGRILNTVMFTLLTLFVLFIIAIAIVGVVQWTN